MARDRRADINKTLTHTEVVQRVTSSYRRVRFGVGCIVVGVRVMVGVTVLVAALVSVGRGVSVGISVAVGGL